MTETEGLVSASQKMCFSIPEVNMAAVSIAKMVIECIIEKKGTYPVMARIHCRQYVGTKKPQRRCVLHARAHIKVMSGHLCLWWPSKGSLWMQLM